MVNPRTMKQKTRVLVLTLVAGALLGLAVGLLPLEQHSANAAPKGDKGDKGGKGGKVAATANVDIFRIEECNFILIWTNWENIPVRKLARADIVLKQDGTSFVFSSDAGHPLNLGTAKFTLDTSGPLGAFGDSDYEVTETRFYDKRDRIIERFITGGTPPLTGITSRTADCDLD